MTTIEYALIAGLMGVALVAVGIPLGRSLTDGIGEIAAGMGDTVDGSCGSAFCVEPAAGDRLRLRARPH